MSADILTLADVKALLGLTAATPADDAALTAAMPVVTEHFENHCKRGLAFVAGVVEALRIESRVGLFRYPVQAVGQILFDGVAPSVAPTVDMQHGLVFVGHCMGYPWQVLQVTYDGGYPQDAVPADLANAYARCCADFGGVTYVSASGGGGAPLKSLGLGSGALTVQFDTGAQSQSAYETSAVPALLAPYLFVLEHYRMKDFV
jgi:hypothetical protein